MTSFLTVDIATKITGWCVFTDGLYTNSGIIDSIKKSISWIPTCEGRKELISKGKPKKDNKLRGDKLHNRLIYQHSEVKKIIKEYKIDYVVKEQTIMCRDNKVALELGESHAIVTLIKIPIIPYYPTEWQSSIKKFLKQNNIQISIDNLENFDYDNKDNLKRIKHFNSEINKSKMFSVIFFYNQIGRLPVTTDESDAYAIGYHHLNEKSYFSYQNINKILPEIKEMYK